MIMQTDRHNTHTHHSHTYRCSLSDIQYTKILSEPISWESPGVHNRTENVLISVKYIQIQLFAADNVKHVSRGRPMADSICRYVLEPANEVNWLNSITLRLKLLILK